jgi:putative tryptophan/tyrosine transport system substrate-binding protein
LPELAADLFRSRVTVIVAIGASMAELAPRATAANIPIVFATSPDAVEVTVVDGRDRRESNGTDTHASAGPASKRLDLLLDMRPGARLIGYLDNSRLRETFRTNVDNVTATAVTRHRELLVFDAGTEQEVDTVFDRMALQRVRGLVVAPDPFLISRQELIIALAAESGVPTIYPTRAAAALGGLMSYGALTEDMYRLAGIYAGRILKGEAPSDSPIALPTRFEFVINRRTAEALRITVPRRLMVRADEVIY